MQARIDSIVFKSKEADMSDLMYILMMVGGYAVLWLLVGQYGPQ